MSLAFPGESAEYRDARERLLGREIELRRGMEAVAAARRELPPGGVVPEDYVFQGAGPDGAPTAVRLSELFAPGRNSLVVYNFMFPRGYGGDRPGPTSGETALLPHPGQDHRSVGTLEPLWNLFDLTREGRPVDWDEQISYP